MDTRLRKSPYVSPGELRWRIDDPVPFLVIAPVVMPNGHTDKRIWDVMHRGVVDRWSAWYIATSTSVLCEEEE
jgi:hypothetical protein